MVDCVQLRILNFRIPEREPLYPLGPFRRSSALKKVGHMSIQ